MTWLLYLIEVLTVNRKKKIDQSLNNSTSLIMKLFNEYLIILGMEIKLFWNSICELEQEIVQENC